jgi:hypothetical protein
MFAPDQRQGTVMIWRQHSATNEKLAVFLFVPQAMFCRVHNPIPAENCDSTMSTTATNVFNAQHESLAHSVDYSNVLCNVLRGIVESLYFVRFSTNALNTVRICATWSKLRGITRTVVTHIPLPYLILDLDPCANSWRKYGRRLP